MSHAFPIDPAEVLGVEPDASLDQIQAAFRAKSKKYHPDLGGDAWAFRILVRCHEILGEARVVWRAAQEESAPTHAPQAPPRPPTGDREVRSGIVDRNVPADRLVGVELLLIRFELDDPLDLLTTHREDRSLSVSLNLNWPDLGAAVPTGVRPELLRSLDSVVADVARQTGANSAASRELAGDFRGWLTYTTASQARHGFEALREALRRHDFGVRQTIRNLSIPRDWQGQEPEI
jgi:hypothetical protein